MESTPQQTAEGKAVVTVLAAVLERLVKSNAHSTASDNSPNGASPEVTKFHALKAPGISIKQYLERIHKYASCSTECFVLALIYIDRLIQNNNFILSELNVHRVVITAILLAAKFFDDAYYNNAYYAKVGGVLVSEMNGLEVEFLFRINFSLHVKPDVFIKYQDELVSHAVGAGLDQQQQLQLQMQQQQQHQAQQQQQPQQPVLSQVGMSQIVTVEQAPQQLQVTHLQTVPAGVNITVHPQIPVGNVTPSPPQSTCMDYSEPQQQHHQQDMYIQQNTNQLQQQQQQPQVVQPSVPTRGSICQQHEQQELIQVPKTKEYPHQHSHYQQHPTAIPAKNYQIQNNSDRRIHPTTDILFATCCPYGGRLNPKSSSPGIFNPNRTRIYQ